MKSKKIKKGCGISLIILIVLVIGFFWMLNEAFGEDKYVVNIEQSIGGKLVCNVTTSADLQSWYYDIEYEYVKSNGDKIDLGRGFYEGIEWDEKDQLYKYKKWIILKTGNFFGSDKIIMFNPDKNEKKEFEFTQRSIENDSLWKSKNIKSLINYSPSNSHIIKTDKSKVLVEYTYRVDEKQTDKLESQIITYILNEESGVPEMKSIKIKK